MVRFGRCAVDVAKRVVERDGEVQHLEPQAFDLLAYLVSHADRVVPKTELLDEVWGDQFVSESALTTRIKEVRRAVGDDGTRQHVVKNFRGRGYRFVAELDDARAASTSESPPTRVPAAATRLIGRETDVDEVAGMLASSRLVTFVGPGGVGKTSLAHEVARRTADRYPDGVRVVRLATVADPAGVIHVLRRDAELVSVARDDASLVDALAALDALVVLDNCEHVLDEASRLVADALERRGAVRVLATSRERLGVPGEQVWPVAPLDDDAARDLLCARARLAQPGFGWGADDEPDVDRILHTIDRLPLAIEMAAARLPTVGVSQLADVLTRRVDLLRSADRTAVERHRTIDALLGWSESLLADAERDLLAAMSVFTGPVTITDIAAVTGADADELATGSLAGLVDKSLTVVDTASTPVTYRLLETVRSRSARRRSEEVDAEHARHIAAVVADCDRRIRTPDEPAASQRLDALTGEVRAAHAWARSHDPVLAGELTAALLRYSFERPWTEPAEWARALTDLREPGDASRLAADAALASAASNRGEFADAERLAHRALASDDQRVVGCALDTLANIGIYTGDAEVAVRHAAAMIELGERDGDLAMRTLGLLGEGLALVYAGRVAEGEEVFERFDDVSDLSTTSAAWVAYAAGEVHAASGRHDDAVLAFRRAIDLGRSVGSHFVVSVSRVASLAAAARAGHADLAAFVPLLEQYRSSHSLTHGITTLRNLVDAMVGAGMIEPAVVLLGALSNPDVKATYGSESERVDAALDAAVAAAGRASVDRWMRVGADHDVAWAIDHAIAVVIGV